MIVIGVTLIHEKLLSANIISKPYVECWQVSTEHGHPVKTVDLFSFFDYEVENLQKWLIRLID